MVRKPEENQMGITKADQNKKLLTAEGVGDIKLRV